jgi:CPA2 family monovalent cation:H+ antiporter-2
MHELPLLTTLAAAFAAAWVLGLITQWMKLSPIVGYLLAGVAIGPYTPGFVGDVGVANQLAEVGVILLMFGVGLHFHLKDLLAVKWLAVPGAVFQSAVATVVAGAVFAYLGWPIKAGLVLGLAMAVASTVVLLRVLMDHKVLESPEGHAAVGWLIVEDLFTIVVLVLLPALTAEEGGSGGGVAAIAWALAKLAALIAIALLAGSRVVPWVLMRVSKLDSPELFTLTVLVLSIAVAVASAKVFGVSVALGAFLAGMVVGQSPLSHRAASDALPMRDAFAVLFFVSVGMLCDPRFVLHRPGLIGAALVVVMIAKPLAALLIVAVLGRPIRTGLTVAVGLAQIGEFSFILEEAAKERGLIPDEGHHVLVTAAIVSIALNPLLFKLVAPTERWLRARSGLQRIVNGRGAQGALGAGAVAGGAREGHE